MSETYSTKLECVRISAGADLQIRSLLDNQQFWDPVGQAEALGISSATWPLFGLVWPSSRRLADLMQGLVLDSQRVLEVGCGLGLASLVLHRRLGDVTASDCHPLAESFLQANARLNHLPPLNYQPGHWARSNKSLGEFDLIIGSDVLYERGHPGELAGFIGRHSGSQTQVMIVDPNRGQRRAFHHQMSDLGFSLTQTVLDDTRVGVEAYRGRLLHYRR